MSYTTIRKKHTYIKRIQLNGKMNKRNIRRAAAIYNIEVEQWRNMMSTVERYYMESAIDLRKKSKRIRIPCCFSENKTQT